MFRYSFRPPSESLSWLDKPSASRLNRLADATWRGRAEVADAIVPPISRIGALRSESTLQQTSHLLQGRGVFDRREIAGVAAFGDGLDRAAKELAAACLRQQVHEVDTRRPSDGTELFVDHLHDLALELQARSRVGRSTRIAQHRESHRDLPLQRIGDADDRDLRHLGVARDALLDFARAQAVARHVDHVVRAAEDVVIAVLVADAPVEGAVERLAGNGLPVSVDVALVIAPDRLHEAGRRRARDDDHALFVGALQLLARLFVHELHVV